MKQYKLVACDLDGTLLDDKTDISSENINAIKTLSDNGIHVVPVTGRALSEMSQVTEISQIRYIISSNGAVIIDKETHEQTYLCISTENSNFVLDTISEYDSYLIVHQNGKTYVNDTGEEEIKSYNVNFAICELIKNYAQKDVDLEKNARLMDNAESLTVFFKCSAEKEKCKKILETNQSLRIADVSEYNLEIFSADAGKDKAVKILAEKLGISTDDIISIGDSDNDTAIIKFVGLGLCVSNGSDELKVVADDVICSNNDHVVKYVLDNYFKYLKF